MNLPSPRADRRPTQLSSRVKGGHEAASEPPNGAPSTPGAPRSLALDFWPIWTEHRDHLFRVCLRALDGNRADAEDALSEVMLKLRDRLPGRIEGIANASAWLARFALNACLDLRRRRRSRMDTARNWSNQEQSDGANGSAEESPADYRASESTPSCSSLLAILPKLPVRLKAPFEMRAFECLPYREIARRLGISNECARKRVQEARKWFRRWLSRPGARESEAVGSEASPPATEASAPVRRATEIVATAPSALRPRAFPWRKIRVRLPDGGRTFAHVFAGKLPTRQQQKIVTLRSYVRKHPRGWKFQMKLADLLYQTGSWAEAAHRYRQILQRRPWQLEAAWPLGEILRQTAMRDEAGRVYAEVSRVARTPGDERFLTALIAWMRADYSAAITGWREAIKTSPAPMLSLRALAACLIEIGDTRSAGHFLRQALELDPLHVSVLRLGDEELNALESRNESRRGKRRGAL